MGVVFFLGFIVIIFVIGIIMLGLFMIAKVLSKIYEKKTNKKTNIVLKAIMNIFIVLGVIITSFPISYLIFLMMIGIGFGEFLYLIMAILIGIGLIGIILCRIYQYRKKEKAKVGYRIFSVILLYLGILVSCFPIVLTIVSAIGD